MRLRLCFRDPAQLKFHFSVIYPSTKNRMLSTVLLAFAGVAAPPAQVLEFDLSYTSKLGHVDRFEHTHTAAVRSPWNLSVNCRPAQLALIYAPPTTHTPHHTLTCTPMAPVSVHHRPRQPRPSHHLHPVRHRFCRGRQQQPCRRRVEGLPHGAG